VNETQTEPKTLPGTNPDASLWGGRDELRGHLMSTEPNPSPADPGGQPSCLSWFMPVGLALEVVRAA